MKQFHGRIGLLFLGVAIFCSNNYCTEAFHNIQPFHAVYQKTKLWVENNGSENTHQDLLSDRRVLLQTISSFAVSQLLPQRAHAQLVQFPCTHLANTYHFMRVGTTMLEAEDIWNTNSLFITNRDDALTPEGHEQVVEACQNLKNEADRPTIVKFGIGAASMDTADIVGHELQLGRDRLVPEFTYLDPRSIGLWDRGSKSLYEPAVWALDKQGEHSRPPPNDDGTSDESLQDPMVRLRQLVSILETHYSGDTILLVFADGTTPAVLSCMLAGIPLSDCHALEFLPGELRQNVDSDSVAALYGKRKMDKSYLKKLDQGKQTLGLMFKRQQSAATRSARTRTVANPVAVNMNTSKSQSIEGPRFRRAEPEVDYKFDDQQRSWMLSLAAGCTIIAPMARNDKEDLNEEVRTKPSGSPALAFSSSTTGSASFLNSDSPSLADVSLASASRADTSGTKSSNMVTDTARAVDTKAPRNVDEETILQQKQEAKITAQEAMEAYLNEDDGESDWLASLHEIIDEGEES